MSPNVFDESIQAKGVYSKKEVQSLEQKLQKMPLEEIRTQLDGLSTQVENKLKAANTGSLDSKYKKFLNVAENLSLVGTLYSQLSPEQQSHVDTYKRESSERSVAVTQSVFMQLGYLSADTVLGVFNKATLFAVIAFQKKSKDYKGQQDGLIGKQTLTALQTALQSGEKVDINPVVAETLVDLQQVKNDIQDVKQKVDYAQQKIDDTQEQNISVPLVTNKSIVFTQTSNDIDAVPAPTVANAQEFVAAVTNIVDNPTTMETLPTKDIPVKELVKDVAVPVANTEVTTAPVVEHKQEEVIPVAEKKQEEPTPVSSQEKVTNTVVEPNTETITDKTIPESTNSEPLNSVYSTLEDYIISYVDKKSYMDGHDIAKISKEELAKKIKDNTKEALIANPGILRYGMVLRAVDNTGISYVGTLVEDPSKKDFTKSNVLRVNRLGKNGLPENIAFPLENIVEVLLGEPKIFTDDQQKQYDKFESKYRKEQDKKKLKASKEKSGE